jgi:hypothetical protein
MKATTYLMSYQPYVARDERCNIGVLVFSAEGKVRLHLAQNLKKVKALDPSANLETLREALYELVKEINQKPDAWDFYKMALEKVRFSSEPGHFSYGSVEDYERQVQWLIQVAAEPRSSIAKTLYQPKSRLFLELKSTFRNYGWLSDRTLDIDDRMVVTHYPISLEEDLHADFATKNGCLHLLETVDFRSGQLSNKRMEARGKALVFDAARQIDSTTSCTFVVAAQDYAEIKSSMNLLNRYADKVAVYESSTDMKSLFAAWASATNRPLLSLPQ